MSGRDKSAWLPDGCGLSPDAKSLIRKHAQRIHLRLTSPDRKSARGACDGGLGEWWSGVPDEVTCPDCLEVVHA